MIHLASLKTLGPWKRRSHRSARHRTPGGLSRSVLDFQSNRGVGGLQSAHAKADTVIADKDEQ